MIALAKQNCWNATKNPKQNRPIMTVGVVRIIRMQLKISDRKLQISIVFQIPTFGATFPLKNEPIACPREPSITRTVIILTTYPSYFCASHPN